MSAFDDLREPTEPIAPDPAFATRLRRRVAEALATPDPTHVDMPTVDLPERERTMTDPLQSTATATATTTATAATITPYIAVAGAAEALAWYADVLDAVETVRYTGDDGRIGHAELDIGGARLMLSDEYPDYDAVAPSTLGGTSTALHLDVPDVDAVWARAIARGATGRRPPEDQPYGDRSCTFVDPFGHRWMVATRIADPTTEEIQAAMTDYTVTAPGTTADPPAHDPTERAD